MQKYLDKVNSIKDLKALSIEELKIYAGEVREFLIDAVTKNGGHLASNLGTIEMTIALDYVFDVPRDKLLWDVGHQSYTHKIITGRLGKFSRLRQNGGISGFPKLSESKEDCFSMGHSSTSISIGLGMARARDLKNEKHSVISVVGDGALTGGMAFEAMNDVGATATKMIVILNDNKMSISKNVGAMAKYLTKLRLSKGYSQFKTNVKKGAVALPFFGDKLVSALDATKSVVKSALQANKMFEYMGFKYIGPVDGHNIANLIYVFKQLKNINQPVLLHLVTNKGNGLAYAEENPSKYHGVSPKDGNAILKEENFSSYLSKTLNELAKENEKIVAITAAMADGTGLESFANEFPHRFFDVGIAEQHAATMAAGLAVSGYLPYFAVYSTFLQRAFDQVLHDIALNNLPVTLCVDRAGVVGADGVTHQGLFDLSYLSLIPNLTIVSPKDGDELQQFLRFSESFNAPLIIRYPKSFITHYAYSSPIVLGEWEELQKSESNIFILAVGNRMIDIAKKCESVNVINARFIKPLDEKFLDKINCENNLIITLEDNALKGGFGQSVLSYLNDGGLKAKISNLGFTDKFNENLSVCESFENVGLSKENIDKIIKNFKK